MDDDRRRWGLAVAERELEKTRKVAERGREDDSEMFEWDAANRELVSQCMVDKRELIDLREQLVKEKVVVIMLTMMIIRFLMVRCCNLVSRDDKETAWTKQLNNLQEEMVADRDRIEEQLDKNKGGREEQTKGLGVGQENMQQDSQEVREREPGSQTDGFGGLG